MNNMNIRQRINASILRQPKLWLWWTTAAVALYLSLGVVFGFDVCDNGQYMTMYANIFTAPDTVGYHFMYYLSGIVGGVVLWALPSMGLLGMRLFGLLCLVACMLTVWRILKLHISPSAIVLGNALSMVAFVALPVTFCYDILSIMLYLLAIEQLLKRQPLTVLFGGCLLGINAFSRTPNVLGFVFAFTPLLMAWCNGASVAKGVRRTAVAVLGVIVGVGAVLMLMWALGHLHIFFDNLATLRQIASDGSGESSHSIGSLIAQQFSFYYIEFTTWLKLASIICIYTILRQRIASPLVRVVMLGCALAVSVWMMWRMQLLQPIWALCAVGCLTVIVNRRDAVRALGAVAFLLMLIFPMGSDSAFNSGSIITMLAAPIAIAVCIRHTQMFRTAYFIVAFALVCVAKMATEGAYFDGGRLWEKTASIENSRAAGILTTPERAAIINEVLDGIKPWVHPGDTMLVYGSMPMLNYLTDTRPAMDCCWPELLSSALLTERLNNVKTLPIVLRQKFVSIGTEFTAPTDSMLHTYGAAQSAFCIDTKIAALNHFLATHPYRIAYDTPHFTLYLPK